MIETRIVSGRIAPSSCSGSIRPSPETIEPRDLETFPLFQMLQRVQNGMMFGAVADQMLSLWREAPGEAKEREVVRFRAAARENDLVRFHPNNAASRSRASSTAARVSRPARWTLEGLPKCRSK